MQIRAETTRTLVRVVIAWMLFASLANGQSIFATLTGMVSDPSGAVVPNAKVHLRNESTGSMRDTVTNSDGYFTFASLAVGDFTYDLMIDAQGFATYKASGIALGGGEKRNINVPDVRLVQNYLACSTETRSELVILIRRGERIYAQVDIDSHQVAAFDENTVGLVQRVADWLAGLYESRERLGSGS